MKLLRRLILRPLRRDLARTLLTILAVALGVAVVVAIDLAGDAATGSFRSSMETLPRGDNMELVPLLPPPCGLISFSRSATFA